LETFSTCQHLLAKLVFDVISSDVQCLSINCSLVSQDDTALSDEISAMTFQISDAGWANILSSINFLFDIIAVASFHSMLTLDRFSIESSSVVLT